MTPEQPPGLRRQRQVFTALGIGIAGSLLFWPVLTSILGICMFVYWIFAAKDLHDKKRMALMTLFISLYVLVIIGSFYSANMDEALFKLQQKSALAMFPLVMATAVAIDKEVCHRILLAFVWFTLAGCFFCLGNGVMNLVQTGSAQMLHGYQMVVLKDMSPFMLGLFCLLSIMYLLDLLYKGRFTRRQRTTYLAVVIFLSLFLFVLGNRNVLLSWSVVLAFFLLRYVKTRVVTFLFFGMLLAAFAAAATFNPSFRRQLHDLTDFSRSNTIALDADSSLGRSWGGKAIRLAIWKCSGDVIEAHWLAGVGSGDVQDTLQAAYERRKFYFASRYNLYNAHNQFVQDTIASGIAGLLLLAACLFVPLFMFIKKPGWQLYCLFLASIFIICMTESILEISKGIVFYSFFNSIFAFAGTTLPTAQKKQY